MSQSSSPCQPGIVLADKPSGPGSAALVGKLRRALSCKKAGHAGTLDRFASGLMILPVGSATPLADFFLHRDKEYEAVFAFGQFTDTHDPEGTVLEERTEAETRSFLEQYRDQIEIELRSFESETIQIPPSYSALKTGGRRFSDLARKGDEQLPESRPVKIYRSALIDVSLERLQVRASFSVGSGTYIRSIARDLSQKLGYPLHLAELRRTRIGDFSISDPRVWRGEGMPTIISPLDALPDWPVLTVLDAERLERLKHGNEVLLEDLPAPDTNFFLLGPGRKLLAWARTGENGYKYRRVFEGS